MDEETKATIEKNVRAVLRVTSREAKRGTERLMSFTTNKIEEVREAIAPDTPENWYGRAAQSCEAVGDAIFNEPGTSQRIVGAFAGKMGMIGVPAVLFSTAAVLGTASTGTAIGSLSGAAFSSAALAWLGGSVAVGSIIITVAGLAGAIGAVLGGRWAAKKFLFGKARKREELNEQEDRVVDASLALAIAFRNEEKAGRSVDPIAARALCHEALKPLCDELLVYRVHTGSWPRMARKRFRDAKDSLESITSFALSFARRNPNLTTGIIGAVITQLLAEDLPAFNTSEQIVLDALRRSKTSLESATDEELAAYVQSLKPSQLQGLSNNLLGISHELRYYVEENNDGDQYVVELFDATNHAGADIKITNTLTGEIREVQLKASNYRAYIEQHSERYADIPVMATEEVAGQMPGIESTGIPHDELTGDVDSVVSELRDVDDPGVLSSMSVAGLIAVARNVRVLLKGKAMSQHEKQDLVSDGARSALISGLVHTVIG